MTYDRSKFLIVTFSINDEYRLVDMIAGGLYFMGCEVHKLVNEDQTWMIWAVPPPDLLEEMEKWDEET